MLRFIWFWTFWHWTTESFRGGSLLHSPLHGIGSHWDEWFRHEASADDRQAVEETGRSRFGQQRFILWLVRHWAREAQWLGTHPPVRFVLAQLAHVPPFDRWAAFEKYRASYGVTGISALVLAEESHGEASDVRRVEAVALPADTDAAAPPIVAEGFEVEPIELTTARRAAIGLLRGPGLLRLLALWVAAGRRPYARWLSVLLGVGWLAVGGIIIRLLAGPDPGRRLLPLAAALVALWAGLVLTALIVAGRVAFGAWRLGRHLCGRLEHSQVRLRMDGGLRLHGGSAGLPFCLNVLGATYRAAPHEADRSWLWQRFFRALRTGGGTWAATGVLSVTGRVESVVLEPKLRACLRHGGIRHILAPRQRDAGRRVVDRLAHAPQAARGRSGPATPLAVGVRPGFASERRRLLSHRCRHVADAVLAVGDLTSARQVAVNALAVVASAAVLAALPDLRAILWPPRAPAAVAPSSPSPYHLWVSLDTGEPEYFRTVLESGYWANRTADVAAYGGVDASVRAEMRLRRLARPTTRDEEDGTVWVERRRRFLTREFAPGERVARYSFGYLIRLGRD